MLLDPDLLGTSIGVKVESSRATFKWITMTNVCRVSIGPSYYRNSRGHSSSSMSPKCFVGTFKVLTLTFSFLASAPSFLFLMLAELVPFKKK